MEMNWTAFGGGFAKAAVESFDKEEEDAKARAALQVKGLYENYTNVVKENRTISNDVKEKINVVKGFAPDASPDQLVALAQDRGILDMLYTRMKDKDFDATGFNINNFVKAAQSDSPLSAEERINKLFTIPTAVDKASAAFKSITPEPTEETGFLSGKYKLRGMEKAAAAYGVPLEQLQAAAGFKRDIRPSGSEYSLLALQPSKTLDQSIDQAAVALAKANKGGNPDEIAKARSVVDNFTTVKEALSDPQQKWLNKVAALKTKQVSGNPTEKAAATIELDAIYAEEKRAIKAKQLPAEERNNLIAEKEMSASAGDKDALAWLLNEASVQGKMSAAKEGPAAQRTNRLAALQTTITTSTDKREVADAKTQFNKELAIITQEARARHIEVKRDPTDKIPSLGALNTFVGTSVAQAVLNAHGSLKGDMAIVTRTGEGGATYQDFDYTGDNPALKKQIQETKTKAAKAALSVFMDNEGRPLDRNVQAVLNSWTGSASVPAGRGLGGRPPPVEPPPPAPAAASNTTVTGAGSNTVITVIDPSGGSHVFKGEDAPKRANAFKSAAGIK